MNDKPSKIWLVGAIVCVSALVMGISNKFSTTSMLSTVSRAVFFLVVGVLGFMLAWFYSKAPMPVAEKNDTLDKAAVTVSNGIKILGGIVIAGISFILFGIGIALTVEIFVKR